MASILWLLIPVAAACGVAVWSGLAGRQKSVGDGSSVAEYQRFQRAMREDESDHAQRQN